MAPKKKFTKETIISVAFDIAKAEGMDHITIRKVAEHMGSSIAPIYVNFTDIDELKKEVMNRIHEISQQMLMTQYSPDPFLNIGIASLKFAREYRVLFNDMVMNNNVYLQDVQPPMGTILEQMKQGPELEGFSDQDIMGVLFKMQVFQMGLSVMDVNGLFPADVNEEKLIEMMESTGKDIIAGVRSRKNGTLK
ncbi:AcrR family transcriptional regulator [Paenibacillus sp. DS2015]|uniref:TetR/AcrR family transcriptional regulator n=1 Tax=Paenibacillus sp. DS2015 TaxID=3373917 RepID=UPI003D19529C